VAELQQITVDDTQRAQRAVRIDRLAAELGQAPAAVLAATVRAGFASHLQQHRHQIGHRDIRGQR
jgi:hypothetical protein